MNSWAVTWGILQAIVIVAFINWVGKYIQEWTGMTWFITLSTAIVLGGLILVIILKLEETK